MTKEIGSKGPDKLEGTANNDIMSGLDGSDKLIGLGGDDKLDGGGGNDVLNGGAGNDWLKGGDGTDVYYFDANDGHDTIVSLDDDDKLMFFGNSSVNVEVVNGHGEVKFGNTVVNVEHASTINTVVNGAQGVSSVASGDMISRDLGTIVIDTPDVGSDIWEGL